MSALDRHPWAKPFKIWLDANKFEYQTSPWPRPTGTSKILVLGRPRDQSRPTVVFLHGLGNDILFPNLAFFRHILSHGFNIATCDLDGHGIGGTTEFSSHLPSTLVEDLVHHLDSDKGAATKYHFCGFSFGAVLSLNYSIQHPKRVASLTLIGMPTDLTARLSMATELLTPLFKIYRDALADYGLFGIIPAIGAFNRSRYPVRLSHTETEDYVEVARKIISELSPLTQLPKVTVPTLMIVGSLDFIANQVHGPLAVTNPPIKHLTLNGDTHFSSMINMKSAHTFIDFISHL
jgi:pimeloyl-ACP methyl ester carboxylesterase